MVKHEQNMLLSMVNVGDKVGVNEIMNSNRFSTKSKLLHTSSCVLCFVENPKSAVTKTNVDKQSIFSFLEIKQAEIILIKSI